MATLRRFPASSVPISSPTPTGPADRACSSRLLVIALVVTSAHGHSPTDAARWEPFGHRVVQGGLQVVPRQRHAVLDIQLVLRTGGGHVAEEGAAGGQVERRLRVRAEPVLLVGDD